MDRAPGMTAVQRRWATVVIAGWLVVHAVAVMRPLLPLPRPWSGELPWQMFRRPAAVDHTLRVEARVGDGAWVVVDLDRWLRYARGSTGERVHDNHPAFTHAAWAGEREAFARWVAEQLVNDGEVVDEIRLIRRGHDVRHDLVRERVIGRYTVRP